MEQTKENKRIKYARLHAMILPMHKEMMEEEISREASKGRRLTISDIVREELDARYHKKNKV